MVFGLFINWLHGVITKSCIIFTSINLNLSVVLAITHYSLDKNPGQTFVCSSRDNSINFRSMNETEFVSNLRIKPIRHLLQAPYTEKSNRLFRYGDVLFLYLPT